MQTNFYNCKMLPPTHVEMFECLLEDIAARLRSTPSINLVGSDSIAQLLVTTSWLETATRYGEALRVLLANDQEAATGPLERALWEMWINWKYLLKSANREHAAAKVLLTAKIDAAEFSKTPLGCSSSSITALEADVDAWAKLFPDAFSDVSAQRGQRKFNWSGISFAAMERKIAPAPTLYKLLSWDSHATIGTVRDVRIRIAGDGVTVSFGRAEDDALGSSARMAYLATEVLFHMFEDWRELWRLPPLYSRISD